mgnify:CR=1 FL=1|tara:strand:- start:3683 stop:4915 length:1233 start_codon:yes stop_codon:yes gene_type:complete
MSINTLEDCLEMLVGIADQGNGNFKILSTDYTILSSIGRQVFKGIALTDRQCDVVKSKLSDTYRIQFDTVENFDTVINTLRMPLRIIDRSHWVKVIKKLDGSFRIGVRFPFSKRYITLMEKLAWGNRKGYHHEKGSHLHEFTITEVNIEQVISAVKDKPLFIIQRELLDAYKKINDIIDKPYNYIPGVYKLELKNLPNRTIEYIVSDIGDPHDTELFKFKDNSIKYGLEYFDQPDLDNSINQLSPLTQKIIRRTSNLVFVDKNKWSMNAITAALLELDRFPLLIVLGEEQAYDELVQTHNEIFGFIKTSEISVMFRVDNNENSNHPFNQYVKNKHINNKIGKRTKVVYISNTKYPKPVMTSDWKPSTVLYMGSQRNSKVDGITFESDLVIHYDTDVTPMAKGFNINVEKL